METTMAPLTLDHCIRAVLRLRWLVLSLSTVVVLALTAGAAKIQVVNDYRVLFSEDDPRLIAFDALEATYAESNAVLIAVTPETGTVFTQNGLSAVQELTEAAWSTPYASRVDSLTNYDHSVANGDELVVGPLVEDASELSDADLARIEDIALSTIDVVGNLISPEGSTAGVAINFVLPDESEQAAKEIAAHLNSLLDKARSNHPETAYHMTGYVIVNQAMGDAARHDSETLVPVVFLIIVGLTAIFLRSFFGTVAVVVIVVLTVTSAMGFVGWTGMVLSPANMGIPIIIMVIAIADSIHITSNALSAMRRGVDRNAAIADSMRINTWPVFLTSLTTAVGFLSLNASGAPPFQIMGNAVAFGILCALAYSLVLLPALLSILPLRVPRSRPVDTGFFEFLADFVIARRLLVLVSFALATVVLVSGIPRIELGDSLTRFFDESYQVRRDSDFIGENLTGIDKLEYSLDSGREGGITDPEYLHKVDAFADWLRRQPNVSHVQAFSDVIKRLNRNMHGDDSEYYRVPDDSELAAQYLLLYEFSLPFGRDLNDRMDVAKSATRMSVNIKDATSRDLRDFDTRAQAWLRANAPDFVQEATGLSAIVAYMTERNIDSMLSGTIIAMALVSFILIWALRSVRIGLLSLLPNFVPALMTFGLWGHFVGRIGLVSTVVLAIVFGIVVDDTIHFLSKYLRGRRDGLPAPEAVRYAFRTVGHALWTTTIVLSAGFMVFVASGFELTWVLGVLVAITVLFALAADFLLLPVLLLAVDRKN